ncbi:MAG TPA: hypothetical protein VFA43_12090 [Gemmatimonadaceae bacterium]|nr:hypothetical protein [Gemmatimonadaceae bacterium]
MISDRRRRCLLSALLPLFVLALAGRSRANDVWLTRTSQQDLGGLEVASNAFWPVTPAGVVGFVWATPSDLTDLLSAKVALIPGSTDAASVLSLYVCPADNNGAAAGACVGPLPTSFSATANKLAEVDVSLSLVPHVGNPGFTYLAILAFTTPSWSSQDLVDRR